MIIKGVQEISIMKNKEVKYKKCICGRNKYNELYILKEVD